MSNALWMLGESATTTSAPAGLTPAESSALSLLAVGTCVLVVWIALRVFRRTKLTLRGAPGRPNTLDVPAVLALYLLFMVTMLGSQLAIAWLAGVELIEGESPPLVVTIPSAILGQLTLAGMCLLLARWDFCGGLRRGLGLSARRWVVDGLRGVVAMLAVWPVCVLLLFLTTRLMPDGWLTDHPLLTQARTAGGGWLAAIVLAVVVVAPLAEELFFRGILQSMLRRWLAPWPAVLVAAALFAAVHVRAEPQALPALFALGAVMGYCYERTGRLLAPMLIHALFNATNIYLTWLGANG